MKKTKQIIALLLCLVMVVAGSVFATVAYLTAKDTVQNTFTVGKIEIALDEAQVGEDGKAVDPEVRVKENKYHLIPGSTYDKDPTVTVKAGSEEAYVRMLVKVVNLSYLKKAIPEAEYYSDNDPVNGIFLLEKLCGGTYDNSIWIFEKFDGNDTYEFRYYETVDAADADVVLDPLFETITIPGTVTETGIVNLKDVAVTVTAQAIQAANFEADTEKDLTAEDVAWRAFDAQNGD